MSASQTPLAYRSGSGPSASGRRGSAARIGLRAGRPPSIVLYLLELLELSSEQWKRFLGAIVFGIRGRHRRRSCRRS